MARYCCESMCFELPRDMVDGIACKRCMASGCCLCKCVTYGPRYCCEQRCSAPQRPSSSSSSLSQRCSFCRSADEYDANPRLPCICACRSHSWATKEGLLYESEDRRLQSFYDRVATSNAVARALARAGFAYDATRHQIRCWRCLCSVTVIDDDHDNTYFRRYLDLHLRTSPHCPFAVSAINKLVEEEEGMVVIEMARAFPSDNKEAESALVYRAVVIGHVPLSQRMMESRLIVNNDDDGDGDDDHDHEIGENNSIVRNDANLIDEEERLSDVVFSAIAGSDNNDNVSRALIDSIKLECSKHEERTLEKILVGVSILLSDRLGACMARADNVLRDEARKIGKSTAERLRVYNLAARFARISEKMYEAAAIVDW